MLDFASIVGFDWDDGDSRKSMEKHGISQREAEQVFQNSHLLVLVDEEHSREERRNHAYGRSAAARLLLVSFTLRHNDSEIRVICARDMSRKERARYAQEA